MYYRPQKRIPWRMPNVLSPNLAPDDSVPYPLRPGGSDTASGERTATPRERSAQAQVVLETSRHPHIAK